MYLLPAPEQLTVAGIQRQVFKPVHLAQPSAALQNLLHAHHQTQHVKRLCNIVLRAIPKAFDLMPGIPHGGQADDRNIVFPQSWQQRKSIHAREHQIQQRQVIIMIGRKRVQGFLSIVKDGNGIVGAFQIQPNRFGNGPIILNDQNFISQSSAPFAAFFPLYHMDGRFVYHLITIFAKRCQKIRLPFGRRISIGQR